MTSPQPDGPDYQETFARLSAMFSDRLKTYGDGPECAEHRDRASQEQRMLHLCRVHDLREAKVLDFGCATGHLLTFLTREMGFRGEYVGYDISADMVARAQAIHGDRARFEMRNILRDGVGGEFDFTLVSGTFNDLAGDNWAWMRACLKTLFEHTRGAMSFNNLSTYVDYFDAHLFYVDPEDVFRFCKEELSPLVTLRHDYQVKPDVVPFEFTVDVFQTPEACRRRLVLGDGGRRG